MSLETELRIAIEEVQSARRQLGAADNQPSHEKLDSAARRLLYVEASLSLRKGSDVSENHD